MSIYDIEVKNKDGNIETLEKYKGSVMLIVNTATGCGFTPQYEGLEKLYAKYKDNGFVVLDFPCNQFGKQAPGTIEEISDFCSLNYKTSFPLYAKVDVNGENSAEIFKFLKSEKGGILGQSIKWNFTKFLVDKDGKVLERFAPTTKPEDIEKVIIELLK